MIARCRKASRFTITPEPTTVYSRRRAPASTLVKSPMRTGGVRTACGASSAPSPRHPPGPTWRPRSALGKVAERNRRGQDGVRVEPGPLPQPHPGPDLEPAHVDLDPAVEDV